MDIENRKICFLGDSITEGWGASEYSKSYVGLFQQTYKNSIIKNNGGWATRIARQKSPSEFACMDRDFIQRIEDLDLDADIIFIFGGTNDFGHGDAAFGEMEDDTPWTFCGALNVLYKTLKERFPVAKIIVATPLHRSDESILNKHNKTLEDYVKAIKEVAIKYSLPVVDLFFESGIHANEKDESIGYLTDGLHPNDAGHKKLFEIIEDYIVNNI